MLTFIGFAFVVIFTSVLVQAFVAEAGYRPASSAQARAHTSIAGLDKGTSLRKVNKAVKTFRTEFSLTTSEGDNFVPCVSARIESRSLARAYARTKGIRIRPVPQALRKAYIRLANRDELPFEVTLELDLMLRGA